MVYIIVAHTFDSGDIVIDDNAYSTYSLAEKALDEFREDNMEFDHHTDSYEIVRLSIMEE